jgi:hypothetical protein
MLEGLYDGSIFREILDSISNTLREIRTNPRGWFRRTLATVSNELQYLIQNANAWFRNKLNNLFNHLAQIQSNPLSWVRRMIQNTFSSAFPFLIQPIAVLRGWMQQISPILSGIITQGFEYIIRQFTRRASWFLTFLLNPHSMILRWIRIIAPEAHEFIINPRQWLISWVASLFGFTISEIRSLPQLLGILFLRNLNQQYNARKAQIENLVCKLILKMM